MKKTEREKQMSDTLTKSELFPMKIVKRITGLTSDTIRVWERRYGAVKPVRTDGNTRMYSEKEIRRLSLLAKLTGLGHRINGIATKSEEELEKLLSSDIRNDEPADNKTELTESGEYNHQIINKYLGLIGEFEAEKAESLLKQAALLLDMRDLVIKVLQPIISEVGKKWAAGEFNISQEHVSSEQIKRILMGLYNSLPVPPGNTSILFSTPEGHFHEFGALIGVILARLAGLNTMYVGPNLPVSEIRNLIATHSISLVVLSIAKDEGLVEDKILIEELRELKQVVDIWIGCNENSSFEVLNESEIRIFHDYELFENSLVQLKFMQ